MIAPRPQADPASSGAEETVSLEERTDAFLRPGGILEKACAHEPFPYESRPQQRQMAGAVAEALEVSQHLLVEAGTGVGKSFAYLVPAILAAKQQQKKVVISTYTISLQEQLMYKDIPFLQEHLGVRFKAVLVKGRTNYLCLRRLARAKSMGADLFKKDPQAELERIRGWAGDTIEGSIQDMEEQPPSDIWGLVCAEQGNCTWHQCPEYGPCFFMKARSQMEDADILVVNHHLFFSDLALRAVGGGFLPRYDVAVLDEAHCVEGVATEHLGLRLSHYAFEHWLRRLYQPDANKGLLAILRKSEEAHLASRLWDETGRFFETMRTWADFGKEDAQRVVEHPIEINSALPNLLGRMGAMLRVLADEIEDPDIQAELRSAHRRGQELREGLDAFLQQAFNDHVYWMEQEGRRRQVVLHSAPVEVGPLLEQTLFETCGCVIMTSATLAVRGEMKYFEERVGAYDCKGVQVGSPFDYARQMRFYVPKDMPDPNQGEAFLEAGAKAIEHFVQRSRGNAFVLFTSLSTMRKMADRVQEFMQDQGYPFLVQGRGASRHVMLQKFQAEPSSVLFGLDSFWMGVDVRGESLSNVIITRLPFSVPDLPVVKARMDRIRERGGNPFRDYALPEAILKFRQGVGRLIRTATDEGIVVILDSRILTKSYGRMFFESIPECAVELIEM